MFLLNIVYGIISLPAPVLALGFGVSATKATGSKKNSYSKCVTQST